MKSGNIKSSPGSVKKSTSSEVGCIEGKFAVRLEYLDCKTMLITDLSVWMPESEGYVTPDTFNVQIRIPELNIDKTLELETSGANKVTTVDLLGDEDARCIPSSMVYFSTFSCGQEYHISKPWLCEYQCAIDGMYARGDIEPASELDKLIKSVESAVNVNMIETAKYTIKLLSRKLKNEKCGSCN